MKIKYEKKENQRIIDSILQYNFKLKGITLTSLDVLFIISVFVISYIMRTKLFPIESGDYNAFLLPWMQKIQELGRKQALATKIGDYTSPYMYLMCLVWKSENTLFALKKITVFFDYVTSIVMFLMVYKLTNNKHKAIISLALVLVSPVVLINSAYWCQCDIIYCSFIMLGLLFFFHDNSRLCFVSLGIAFSFKLQTVFILPFILVMWLKNKTIKIKHIIYIPIVYCVMHIPAWLCGKPFKEWIGVYFSQGESYSDATLNYPNIYTFLNEIWSVNHHTEEVAAAGVYITIILLGIIAYYICYKKVDMNNTLLITLALFMVAVTVYTLPHMHERYGFLVDLLSIAYGVMRPKKLFVPLSFMIITTMMYMPFLASVHIFSTQTLAVAMLLIIVYIGYDLYNQIKTADAL